MIVFLLQIFYQNLMCLYTYHRISYTSNMANSKFQILWHKPLRPEIRVYETEYEQKKCAAKVLTTFKQWSSIVQYVNNLKALKNPNIVRYLHIYNDPHHGRVLLMELIHNNLTEHLEKESVRLSFIVQVNLTNDILRGLSFLHSQGIIHGNLKSNNILVTENERAKISDYGLTSTDLGVPYKPDLKYMPINFTQPSDKTDIFSFGILGIQILNQQKPIPSLEEENEEARWQSEIDKVEPFHPLRPVILRCINDEEKCCPTAEVLVSEIKNLQQSKVYIELNKSAQKEKQLNEEVEKLREKLQKFQQLPLTLPSTKWFAAKENDLEMRRSADAVTDGSKVYIRLSHDKKVLVFNLESNQWEKSLSCTYYRSSLVVVDDKLIAVGGTSNTADGSDSTNKLIHIAPPPFDNKLWKRMTKARNRCTSVTWSHCENNFLAIAGGENPVGTILQSVEVLNITADTWSLACPLPETRYSCSAALVNNHLYLLGGWKGRQRATRQVLRCSIDKLLNSCTAQIPDTWEELDAELPVAQTTCVSFQNQLLTFGGTWCECYECACNNPTRPSRNIYTYDEEREIFECIGSTPAAQYLCFACVYEYNKIFIAGGAANEDYSLKDVYIFDTARLV